MLTGKEQQLLDVLESEAKALGIDIVTVEIAGARKSPLIRIYIDTPNGVTFDDIARAQKWINDRIDAVDPFPGAYMLEVSSPGIDRPLRTIEHFRKAKGESVIIKTFSPVEGRSKFSGELVDVQEDTICIQFDDTEVVIPLTDIKKANVKGTICFS